MGLMLLKSSGWDVPEETMKRLCEPIIIGSDFIVPSNMKPSAFVLEEIKNRIADAVVTSARKHIYYEVKELTSGEKHISGSLIIQREDPPNNQP